MIHQPHDTSTHDNAIDMFIIWGKCQVEGLSYVHIIYPVD